VAVTRSDVPTMRQGGLLKDKKPTVFGKRPIRNVDWGWYWDRRGFCNGPGCTQRDTQERSYWACVDYDLIRAGGDDDKYSAFLGYL
jgi:hypothetical protein